MNEMRVHAAGIRMSKAMYSIYQQLVQPLGRYGLLLLRLLALRAGDNAQTHQLLLQKSQAIKPSKQS
ncbi:hypothetical protein [Alkanindiges illinoisensis]|uniref:hypothetical protein n=1 Tax=Alkanindiges illinoisensis TaxID=197183 RepID=UPI00047A3AC9|nr:hypothetical protein [Alkanindiges illinoisensis]